MSTTNALDAETVKEQSISAKDNEPVPITMDPSRHTSLNSLDTSANLLSSDEPNLYAPNAQTFTYGAYENSPAEGEEYTRHFVKFEAVEAVPTGIYGENQSLMLGNGYRYTPQMPYGPYSPVTTPLPSSGDGQLYYPQYFPSAGPYFQQSPSSNMPYLHATFPMSRADLTMPVDKQGASSESIGPVDSYGRGIVSSSSMVSQQQTPFYAFGSLMNSHNRGYFHGGKYQHGNNFGEYTHRMVNDGRSFIANDQGRRRGKGNTSMLSFNDHLNEQNRGPRAFKPKNGIHNQGLSVESKNSNIPGVDRELYSTPDFSIHYKDAKFFIIKSYNEDNVHKSIKYGVWASTANGNKKLDAAYREAKEREKSCPVFLFFSVNASAQFCGIAEMIGPVDFDKSVDYWQQDKWSGQFPVKWHIIKDVPNNMFRHIILESNDNKPVTNSRDTQEVKLENGLEMLGILKKYEADTSILDDFGYYEELQMAMEESKAQQQQEEEEQLQQPNIPNTISLNPAPMPNEFVGQISRNFAQVVRLGKIDKDCTPTDNSNSAALSKEVGECSGDKK